MLLYIRLLIIRGFSLIRPGVIGDDGEMPHAASISLPDEAPGLPPPTASGSLVLGTTYPAMSLVKTSPT